MYARARPRRVARYVIECEADSEIEAARVLRTRRGGLSMKALLKPDIKPAACIPAQMPNRVIIEYQNDVLSVHEIHLTA